MITRHFIDVGTRRVHYRKCGRGPALLMVHQSPRSSKEYEVLMREWGAHFTCIAPDSPGFGQSDPLPGDPDINDFADANIALLDALGLGQVAAYGFHSGGIILVTALKRHPQRFTRLAVGGYAIWTPEEMAIFGESYLPPFQPSAYGEHLTWLWNRILEQSWVFPWFDARDEARLPNPHDDPEKVHAVVMEMLDSGDAYRAGYGAVLRAPRDIPPVDAVTPPVLITAYDGDPLQAHIDRLGPMPDGWSAAKVATPAAHQAASLAFLRDGDGEAVGALPEVDDEGFVHIKTDAFDGLIHWKTKGQRGDSLWAHAPGEEIGLWPDDGEFSEMDMPGHGLSDDWIGEPPTDWTVWGSVLSATADNLGFEKSGAQHRMFGDVEKEFPDLTPDRHGHYLTTAWNIVRARRFFSPWYEATADNALPIDQSLLTLNQLAREHRALIRAKRARAYALASKGDC